MGVSMKTPGGESTLSRKNGNPRREGAPRAPPSAERSLEVGQGHYLGPQGSNAHAVRTSGLKFRVVAMATHTGWCSGQPQPDPVEGAPKEAGDA